MAEVRQTPSARRVLEPILLRIACDGLLTIQPEIRHAEDRPLTCGQRLDVTRMRIAARYSVRISRLGAAGLRRTDTPKPTLLMSPHWWQAAE